MSAWDNIPDDDKTIATLTARLLKEETMNSLYGGDEAKDAAFFARYGKTSSHGTETKASTKPKALKCEYCKKIGHAERTCRILAREEASANASMATSKKNEEDDAYAFTSCAFAQRCTADWYADSGATQHMTDQRDMFSSFQSIEPGTWDRCLFVE